MTKLTQLLLGLGTTLFISSAMAQSVEPLKIQVTPEVAEPGVPRTISISGSWPSNCSLPGEFNIAASPVPSATNDFSIISSTGIVFSPCPPAGTLKISRALTYTPAAAGVQKMTVTFNARVVLQGDLITRPAGGARAAKNVTGAWHDPAVSGSGLSFYHSQTGSDLAAGALYLFDSSGKPHWLLLNNLRWTDEARFNAELFNVTSGTTGGCLLLPACARPQSASTQVGRVNGEVQADGRLRLAITAGPPFADPPFPYVLTLERLSF